MWIWQASYVYSCTGPLPELPVPVYISDVRELDTIFTEEATMHNQHPLVQHMRQRQPAEGISEQLHHL